MIEGTSPKKHIILPRLLKTAVLFRKSEILSAETLWAANTANAHDRASVLINIANRECQEYYEMALKGSKFMLSA